MMLRRIALAFAAILGLMAAMIGVGWYESRTSPSPPGPAVGGPFALTDQDGRAVTDATYRGRWLVIYFGYTFCPDACPTTLGRFADMLAELGPLADRVQPMMISVDPGRDTPAVLKDYVAAFDPRIVGLTGTPDEVAAAARVYRSYYKRIGDGDDYSMDHMLTIYLVDPDGRFLQLLPHDGSGKELAAIIRKLL